MIERHMDLRQARSPEAPASIASCSSGNYRAACPTDPTGMSTTFFARAVKVCADMKVAISGMLGTISVAFCSGR